jgi:hypothetical protein
VFGFQGVANRNGDDLARTLAGRKCGRLLAEIDLQSTGIAFETPAALGCRVIPGEFEVNRKWMFDGKAREVPIGRDLGLQVLGETVEPEVEQIEIVDGKIEKKTAFGVGSPAAAANDFKAMGDSHPGRMLQKDVPGRVVALDEPIAQDSAPMGGMFDQAACRRGRWSERLFHQQMKPQIQGFQG